MTPAERKIARNWQKQAAFNAEAAMHNLLRALERPEGWERNSALRRAKRLQEEAAHYSSNARFLAGIE